MTEREVVGRIEADLAATCPPGSNHAYALVRKTDLRALLSSLAEKEARVGELERERDEWRRLYEREEKAHAEQKAIALKQFNRALAAEARIRELENENRASVADSAASPNASGAGTASETPCQSEWPAEDEVGRWEVAREIYHAICPTAAATLSWEVLCAANAGDDNLFLRAADCIHALFAPSPPPGDPE